MKVKSRWIFKSFHLNTKISQKLRDVCPGWHHPFLPLQHSFDTGYSISHQRVTKRDLLPHCHVQSLFPCCDLLQHCQVIHWCGLIISRSPQHPEPAGVEENRTEESHQAKQWAGIRTLQDSAEHQVYVSARKQV